MTVASFDSENSGKKKKKNSFRQQIGSFPSAGSNVLLKAWFVFAFYNNFLDLISL